MKKNAVIPVLALSVFMFSCGKERSASFDERTSDTISYASDYGGHLQGMTTDYRNYIYWSHTTQIVKTDLNGNIVSRIDVPTHHGDLAYYKDRIYVAVNFGKFNEAPGLADSWVHVYRADDLGFIKKYPVPEAVHGAGGIAIHNDVAMVVGGLPPGNNVNFIYEYDMEFNLKKLHRLPSGYTYLGIQTATWFDGYWYFGCYASPHNPEGKVLKASMNEKGELELAGMYDKDMSYGIIGLKDNLFLCSSHRFKRSAGKMRLE
jgi:hypothetical protein